MSGRLKDRVEAEAQRLLRERAARLKQTLDEALAALGQPMRLSLAPGEWGAAEAPAQLQTVRDATESIARAATQREILSALLDAAAAFYPRAALFITKGTSLAGWAGLGFLGEGGFKSGDLSRVLLPASGNHLLAHAMSQRSLSQAGAEGPGPEIVKALGGLVPDEANAVPLQVRGRPVAVLYADSGSAEGTASQGLPLEILARIAAFAMERLASTAEARRGPDARAVPGEGADLERASAGRGAPARSTVVTPPEEAEVRALLTDLDGRPRREAGDDGLSNEERRHHADARRFAHLLVSELLLYNEEAVVLGRKNRDLQERLRKEIDRSRQAYLARAAGLARRGPDYFQEELVRQLAQGDPSVLGS